MGRMSSMGSMMSSKRGQITLFIILGIVLLFSTAIILFIKSKAVQEMPEMPQITETLPAEIQPFRDYVEDCVYFTAKDAIEMIGVHGGYVGMSPQDTVYTARSFDLDIAGLDPTSHRALTVSQGWHIPYWSYMSSANDCRAACKFGSERPPLLRTQGSGSIESQIDNYVKRNIDGCLADFPGFADEGFSIEKKGNISVKTMITDRNVIVFAEYPFDVSVGETRSMVTQYMATLGVNLKGIYGLATEITALAADNKFLEQHALNLIAGFSGMDEKSLPPMSGTDFNFVSKRWLKSEVAKKLQDILSVYVNLLQATRTRNFRVNYFPNDEFKTGLYSHMVLPLEGSYYDTTVDFNYLGWPLYFYIAPGDTITAREGVGIPLLSLFIPFQRYDLPYDLSFPVMVEMRDMTAYNGEGYSFFIGLEGNIRNNEPVTEDFVAFEQMSDVTAQVQLCNENQRTSGDVTITTTDTGNKPLEGAMIFFSIGELMCPIGETKLTADRNMAVYTGKFPVGAVGTLVVMHPDAAPYSQEFFRAKETPMFMDSIALSKYVMINASAVKLGLNKDDENEWVLDPSPSQLSGNEEFVVMLEKVKEKQTEPDVVAAASVKQGQMSEIRLVPGKYKMTATLMRDKVTLKLPKQTVGGQEMPETTVIDNSVFPTTYEAFVIFDNSIYSSKGVEFKALSFNWPEVPEKDRTLDDMLAWGNMTQYATEYIYYLTPSLK